MQLFSNSKKNSVYKPEINEINNHYLKVPASTPPNLQLVTKTEDSLTFSWDQIPCDATNGNIIGYDFRIANVSSGVDISSHVHFAPQPPTVSQTVRISRLECNMTYRFEVAGQNRVGSSSYTSKNVTTESRSTYY